MIDTFRDKGLRKQMVEDLQKKGISDERLLEVFKEVPRHYFVPDSLYEHAYADIALPIACKQTISQPYTVAIQTQLLEVKKNQRLLEIGTGSGYQAVILKKLGAYVYTIERQKAIFDETKKLFERLGLSIAAKYGDGHAGWTDFAPFDGIVITCGANEVPKNLLTQLKIGGKMVVPIGEGVQTMTRIIRLSETEYETTTHGVFRFVPML
jgi:protein-L-isoaspartate(D-aspartate) O-methyltransferase